MKNEQTVYELNLEFSGEKISKGYISGSQELIQKYIGLKYAARANCDFDASGNIRSRGDFAVQEISNPHPEIREQTIQITPHLLAKTVTEYDLIRTYRWNYLAPVDDKIERMEAELTRLKEIKQSGEKRLKELEELVKEGE